MDTPTFRQRLALRLEGFPLARTLVLDGAFFAAFVTISFIVLAIAISLPKIWRTTPRDFSRATVRVSLIDLAQAWSLSRAADRAEARGDHAQALLSRRGALLNNLGDPDLHRAILVHLRDVPEARPEHVLLSVFSSSWLLALANTNQTDLELAAEVAEKFRLPDLAVDMIASSPYAHSPALAAVRARAILAAGRADEFLALWKTHESTWSQDPRQRLYHDAWMAGWETGSPAIEAMLRLKKTTEDPGNLGLAAARLLLMAAPRRGGPEDVALAVDRLERGAAASVAEHARYWRFLAAVGRFDEARARALAFGRGVSSEPAEPTEPGDQANPAADATDAPILFVPRVAQDAAEYASVLAALGESNAAVEFLERHLNSFQSHPTVWQVYLSTLIDSRRWNDVRRAAARARMETASFETVRILALYAEYRAEVGQGRSSTADTIADQLAAARILDNRTALVIASALVRDGRARQGLKLLRGKRADMADLTAYWQAVFSAALHGRDLEGLQESTSELLRMTPNSPIALSNRAAMLIATEENPAEALEITFRLVTEHPNSIPFRINHAFALLLNRRVDEAWDVLSRLDPARLERQAAAAYHLAMTQALYARGDYAKALEESDKVQPGLILPPQVSRLEKLRIELRAKVRS